ncbi:MAG: ParA family protein [Dehalococcoidia bacterium]
MILAVVNQKGGVGKTTTAINLGAYLTRLGRSVLVVDCDPQANATTALGVERRQVERRTLYEVLTGDLTFEEIVLRTAIDGLDLAPSSPTLAGAEVELVEAGSFETRFRELIRPTALRWDYTLLDCPPSLGVLTANALVSADGVLVPVQCEYLALEGLAQLMRTVELVRSRANPSLRVAGLVLTMYDSRTNLSQQVADEVRSHFPATFEAFIPRTIRLGEAPSFGQTILEYDPASRGAAAYNALAAELVARLEGTAGGVG